MTQHRDDDRLRGLIRRADPSASLAHLPSDYRIRLVEDTMTQTRTAPETRTARTTRRGWLVAGAVGAVAAAAIAVPLALGPATTATTLELPAAAGPAEMCLQITPDVIAQHGTAFRAEVTSIEDGTVTLAVRDRFAGEVGGTVEIAQGADSVVDGAPIVFADGATYLIAATDGVVATCGVSGEDSPELDALYREAFDG